jgi:hypothetical protein
VRSERGRRIALAAPLVSAILCAAGLAAGSVTAVGAPSAPTCRSGQTLFASGAVRAFQVTDTNANQEAFVCVSSSAEPVVIDNPGPAIGVQAYNFHIRGARLGFEIYDVGLGMGGSNSEIGWVDLQTGEVAIGPAEVLNDPIGYAFAPDGTIAVIAGTSCEVVAVLPLRAKLFAGVYRLGPPRIVFTAHHGGLVHWSIAITATTVTWRTVSGSKSSAPWVGGSTETTPHTGGC